MCTGTHPYIPIANVAKIEVFMTQDVQHIENVFHAYAPSGFTGGSLEDLATVVDDWVTGSYMIKIGSQVDYNGVKITDLTTESGPVYEMSRAVPVAGAIGSGERYPAQNSAVISWNTAQRGRSFRGRTYVPGLRSTFCSGSTLTNAFINDLSTAFGNLKADLADAGYTLVIASLCNGKAWRTTGTFAAVTTFSVNPTVATQRRRLPGRGT